MKRITLCFLAVLALSTASAYAAKKDAVMVPLDQVKWFPMDPKNPDGGKMGVAYGDPMKGAAAIYLNLPKGPAPMHSHTSDYFAVSVKGETKHWVTGDEASATAMPTGSFWFQPGKQAHGDSCVSDDGCILFIHVMGKFDFIPAPAAKK